MKLINIGFSNFIVQDRVISVLSPDSAPIKRVIQDSKEKNMLIDASFGRSTKSVIFMDNGNIILSSVTPETISQKFE